MESPIADMKNSGGRWAANARQELARDVLSVYCRYAQLEGIKNG